MFTRITRAINGYVKETAGQSAIWANFARDAVKKYAATAHRTVLILGLLAIGLLGMIFVRPEIADQLKELSPFAQAVAIDATVAQAPQINTAAAVIAAAPVRDIGTVQAANADKQQQAGAATSAQQKWVTSWLAKRYRVAGDAIHSLVSTSYQVAKELKLDPLLILSVIAIESRFNPFSESPVGAQGLMQVMSKVHQDKFQIHGGIAAALNPVTNIKVGSRILKDYVTEGGSVEAGLKKYVGAAAFATDFGYGHKVLSEYRYLQEVAKGKKVPYATARATPREPPKTVINNAPAELLPELLPNPIDDLPERMDPADQLAAV